MRSQPLAQPNDMVTILVPSRHDEEVVHTLRGRYIKPSDYVRTEHLIEIRDSEIQSRDFDVCDPFLATWLSRRKRPRDVGHVWVDASYIRPYDAVTRLGELAH